MMKKNKLIKLQNLKQHINSYPKDDFNLEAKNEVITFLVDEVGVRHKDIIFGEAISKIVDYEQIMSTFKWWISFGYDASYAFISVACFFWPYVAISFFPLAFEILFHFGPTIFCIISILNIGFFVCLPSFIDSTFYGLIFLENPALSVINQLKYNLVGGANLYGTEGSLFYFKNLFVNFNIAFPMALLALAPAILLCLISKSACEHFSFEKKQTPRFGIGRDKAMELTLYLSPLYTVLPLLTAVSHKEERFLSQAYPAIVLGTSVLLSWMFNLRGAKVLELLLKVVVGIVLGSFAIMALSRNIALAVNFSAPQSVFYELGMFVKNDIDIKFLNRDVNFCMGKDWHRFPSSFFLPDIVKMESNFVKKNRNADDGEINIRKTHMLWLDANFTALLPQPFGPYPEGLISPKGNFNNMNQEEHRAYSTLDQCDFVIDSVSGHESADEFTLVGNPAFSTLICKEIVDLERSKQPWRSFYLPFYQLRQFYHYSDFCVFVANKLKR